MFRKTTAWWFPQDNDSKHACTLAKYFFMKHGVHVLDWPSNSPDLNPIENLWHWVKREVDKLETKSLEDLEQSFSEYLKKIPISLLQSLIESMKKRLELCITSKGGKISY